MKIRHILNLLIKIFFLCIFIFSLHRESSAQNGQPEGKKCWFNEVGLAVGYCFVGEKLPEGGKYKPLLLLGQFAKRLGKYDKPGGFEFIAEPQFNPVSVNEKLSEADFGVNFAIRYRHSVWRTATLYAQIGTGPHFITLHTSMQAHGYIFSDNLAAGFSQKIGNEYTFHLQCRFRHLSNANLMKPNLGIDNFFVIFGIVKSLAIY